MQNEYSDTYSKWRGKIMRANFFLAVILFLIEVGMYFVLKLQNLILQPLPEYIFRFLVFPTFCDIFIIAVGFILAKKMSPNSPWRNYVPVVQMSSLALVIAGTHYVFSVTLCIFCFPIFVTALFGDRKLSSRITVLNLIYLIVTLMTRYILGRLSDPYLLPEAVVSLIIVMFTFKICNILIAYEEEKNGAIQTAYKKQLEMKEQLSRDQKTGLFGAVALQNLLSIAVGEGSTRPLVLALLDIDNFKHVNDCYGHSSGDRVINRLAGLMLRDVSDDILPARFGGDEFALVFRIPREDAIKWMDELREQFAGQEYEFMDESVTISVGIDVWDGVCSDKELFANADAAMYASKQKGKNSLSLYSAPQDLREE
ncbi:MAG: GGDEF domain-containing protein [Oscillospiraceae bacterium]